MGAVVISPEADIPSGRNGGAGLQTLVLAALPAVGVGVTVDFVQTLMGLPLWAAGLVGFPVFFGLFWGGLWLLRGRK